MFFGQIANNCSQFIAQERIYVYIPSDLSKSGYPYHMNQTYFSLSEQFLKSLNQ